MALRGAGRESERPESQPTGFVPVPRAERIAQQKVDDVEKAYDFFRKNNFFDRTGKISRVKLNALIDALVGLGDLPARGNIERFLLPGVAELSD